MTQARDAAILALAHRPFRALRLDWNPTTSSLRIGFRVHPIQCFSLALLNEMKLVFECLSHHRGLVRYVVLASDVPRVFNFGGDLALFALLVRSRDLESLKMYGNLCIDLLWWIETADECGIMTIGLVQGDCLGGGFESVLPTHRIIAERSVQAGFPEILFNLYPGMGAWNMVFRKAGHLVANEMILSGKLYSADDLHAKGLFDLVVDDHEGETALEQTIRAIEPHFRGTLHALRARRMAMPISRDSLLQIVDHWAESAMQLTDRDLRLMERLARAQIRKVGGADAGAVEEIKRIELEQAKLLFDAPLAATA